MRNIPDVALTADHCLIHADGQDITDQGGTSFAAPLWAGFTALVNQQAAAYGNNPTGFINPAIYSIGSNSYPNGISAFHDVLSGNNEWSQSQSKFSAEVGYDLCTGWGTPDGQDMINFLSNPGTGLGTCRLPRVTRSVRAIHSLSYRAQQSLSQAGLR